MMRPQSSLLLRLCRSTAQRRFHSHPAPYPPSGGARRQQQEEESRGVRVSVWWDFENCHLPQGCNVFRVAHCLTSAVRASGIKGPVHITAFGDVSQLSRSNQEALSSTGISLSHVPTGGKNSADRSLLIDLMCWVSHNPPPAHLFLISGDRDFAIVLHRLRMSNYNILLAGPESSPGVLCSAASIVWQWNALAKGENVTGKYFNQPPDGPYNSWYGHYKVPIENPFTVIEQPSCPKLEEIPESNQDPKPRQVPRMVIKQIRHILCTHPKGISITDLRSELGKVNIDKDLYGFRKFSRFLLSMPHLLKLQSGPDGQLFVLSATLKWPEFNEPAQGLSSGLETVNEEGESLPNPVVSTKGVNGKPLLPKTTEQNVKPYENIGKPSSTGIIRVNFKGSEEKIENPLSPRGVEVIVKNNEKIEKVVKNNDKVEKIVKKYDKIEKIVKHNEKIEKFETSNSPSAGNCNFTPEVGIFGRTWRQWLFGMDDVTGIENSSGKSIIKNVKVNESNSGSTSQIKTDDYSNGKSTEENSEVKVADSDKVTGDVGIFKRMAKRCMFWRGRPINDDSNEQSGEDLESIRADSGKHELFSRKSFWKELEEFLNTPPNGSVLVLHSMSRKQMAHNLQKHGPSILRPLSQSDLLHLVDLLITDKRWVEESLTQAYPFKLILPPKYNSSPNKSSLSSAFMGSSSASISEKNSKNQNSPHDGISSPITDKETSGFNKSRNDILSDFTKLVEKIVKKNPEGFNMGSFRKCFLDEYGYPLDIQKLGYQKLVTLLQIMPGVKVESCYIYPIFNGASGQEFAPFVEENNNNRISFKSHGESSDPSNKDDDLDTTWDELGPVSDTGSNQKEFGSQKSAKRLNRDYEALKDDVISDSEEETLEVPEKPKVNQEDSSLLRILDSWYGSKEEKYTKEISESEDDVAKNCQNKSKGSYGCGSSVMKTEASSSRYGENTYSARKISFVSEKSGHNSEKLIDGIMGSLQKSSESRVH